jgi:hypothetical protein
MKTPERPNFSDIASDRPEIVLNAEHNGFVWGAEYVWTNHVLPASSQIEDLTKERDRYREALEEVVRCCNAAGGPDEQFMDTIILDIKKRATTALHPLVKEGE